MGSFDILARKLGLHYSYFQVSNRLLFTGHQHQAWPDVAFDGQKEAFRIASDFINAKWTYVLEKQDLLRQYLQEIYADPTNYYTFASSVQELLTRFLFHLDLKNKPKIIATEGDDIAILHQISTLESYGLQIVWVKEAPLKSLAARIAKEVDSSVSAIITPRVFASTGLVSTQLSLIAKQAEAKKIPLLVNDYYGTHAIPLDLTEESVQQIYLLSGGYKYLQWGEGNCFLRSPVPFPISFEETTQYSATELIEDTFDPVSVYRAAEVLSFFKQNHLTLQVLAAQYSNQIAYMAECFLALGLPKDLISVAHEGAISDNAAFLVLHSPSAVEIGKQLIRYKVYIEVRSDAIVLGPAPYTQRKQIYDAFQLLKQICNTIKK